jgi:hypothetical protein
MKFKTILVSVMACMICGHAAFGSWNPGNPAQPANIITVFGANPDGVTVMDGAITSGTKALACHTSTPFNCATDVGKQLLVAGAGASGATLGTTISACADSGDVTLTVAAGSTVTNAAVSFGTDQSTIFQKAVNTLAGTGTPLLIPASVKSYFVAVPITVTSGFSMIGQSGARVIANIQPGGSPTNAALIGSAGAAVPATTTTLSAQTVLGSDQFSVTSASGWTKGAASSLTDAADANHVSFFFVQAISGTTITVDRPLLKVFANASTATTNSSMFQNVVIDGQGMSFSGLASRYIELLDCRHCRVSNVTFDAIAGVWADTAFSFDTGGYDSEATKLSVDCSGATSPPTGYTLEADEATGFVSSVVRNCGTGAQNLASTNTYWRDFSATNNVSGLNVDGDGTTSSLSPSITGGHFDGNTTIGIGIGLVQGMNAVGWTANYNGLIGLQILGTALADNQFTGTIVSNAAASGVVVASGAKTQYFANIAVDGSTAAFTTSSPVVAVNLSALNTGAGQAIGFGAGAAGSTFAGVDISGAGNVGIVASVDSTWSAIRSSSSVGLTAHFEILGTANVNLSDSWFNATGTNGSPNVIYNHSTGQLNLSNVEILLGSNEVALLQDVAGVTSMTHVTVNKIGAATNTTAVSISAGTVKLGYGSTIANTATPIGSTGGSVTSVQGEGDITTAAVGGTLTLTTDQAKASALRATGALTSNLIVNVPAKLIDMGYDAENLTSGAFSVTFGVTGGTGVVVAQGKRARLKTDATGMNMVRVSPDT